MDEDEYSDRSSANSIEMSSYNRVRKNDAQVGLTSQVTTRKPITTVQRLCGHMDTKESYKLPRKASNYMAAKLTLAKTLKRNTSVDSNVTSRSAKSKAVTSTNISSGQKDVKESTKSARKASGTLPVERAVSKLAKTTGSGAKNVRSRSTSPISKVSPKTATGRKLYRQKDIKQSTKSARNTSNTVAAKRTVSKTTKSTISGTKRDVKVKENRAKSPVKKKTASKKDAKVRTMRAKSPAKKKLPANKIKKSPKSAKGAGVKKPRAKSSSKGSKK